MRQTPVPLSPVETPVSLLTEVRFPPFPPINKYKNASLSGLAFSCDMFLCYNCAVMYHLFQVFRGTEMNNYNNKKPLKHPEFNNMMFSIQQVEEIHSATLKILSKTGVKVDSSKAVEIFSAAGATVERYHDKVIVKIPPELVDECIKKAPENITYCGRLSEDDYSTKDNNLSFTTFGECNYIIDMYNRKVRPSIKKDCHDSALICDAIDTIKVVERPLNPSDCPPATQTLHNAEAIFTNTTKHAFIGAGDVKSLNIMDEIAKVCLGGKERNNNRKIFTTTVCPVSPLALGKGCCEIIIEAARLEIGLLIFAMPLAGATAPVTLAGVLVLQNAEILSGLVLAQLTKQGTPCTYGSAATIMDLTHVDVSLGALEMALLSAASARMAQFYNLPSLICGGMSDSKVPDAQAGYEFSYSALLCAQAGGNFISGLGVLEKGITFDYAKLMMDVEMSNHLTRVIKGIDTSPDHLALETIDEVGHGGEYLTHMHTFEHMRKQSTVNLFNRLKRPEWQEAGGKYLAENAYEEAESLIKNHRPDPLSQSKLGEISALIRQYELELGIKRDEDLT